MLLEKIKGDLLSALQQHLPIAAFAAVIFATVYLICVRFSLQKKYREEKIAKEFLKKTGWEKFISRCLLVLVLVVMIRLTFFSREPGSRGGMDWHLLSTWGNDYYSRSFFIENILLFIPLGFLLPHSFKIFKKFWCTVLFCILFSIVIETMQVLAMRGYGQIDDILTNVSGAALGWFCNWRVSKRIRSG